MNLWHKSVVPWECMTITSLHVLSSSLRWNFCTINRDKHLYPKLYIQVIIFHHEALNSLNGVLFNHKMLTYYLQIQPSHYVHLPSAIRGQSKTLDLTHPLCLAPAGTRGSRAHSRLGTLRAKATLVSANYSNKQTNKLSSLFTWEQGHIAPCWMAQFAFISGGELSLFKSVTFCGTEPVEFCSTAPMTPQSTKETAQLATQAAPYSCRQRRKMHELGCPHCWFPLGSLVGKFPFK